MVTTVGTLVDLTPGEAILARGWWRNELKHGWQLQVVDDRLGRVSGGKAGQHLTAPSQMGVGHEYA